jgi:hypothetical protein
MVLSKESNVHLLSFDVESEKARLEKERDMSSIFYHINIYSIHAKGSYRRRKLSGSYCSESFACILFCLKIFFINIFVLVHTKFEH